MHSFSPRPACLIDCSRKKHDGNVCVSLSHCNIITNVRRWHVLLKDGQSTRAALETRPLDQTDPDFSYCNVFAHSFLPFYYNYLGLMPFCIFLSLFFFCPVALFLSCVVGLIHLLPSPDEMGSKEMTSMRPDALVETGGTHATPLRPNTPVDDGDSCHLLQPFYYSVVL